MATVSVDNVSTQHSPTQKCARPQGRNISKLMRFFDSSLEKTTFNSCAQTDCSTGGMLNRTECHAKDLNAIEGKNCHSVSKEAPSVNNMNGASNHQITKTDSITSVSECASLPKTSHQNSNILSSFATASLNDARGASDEKSVPYCRKVSKNSLWDNVNSDSNQNTCEITTQFAQTPRVTDSEIQQLSNSVVKSTTELNHLIARVELSRHQNPLILEKSKLENYFTSFENPASAPSQGLLLQGVFGPSPLEMRFEEDPSDSSEEEEGPRPPIVCPTYLPAYALHTIIEESCEESDSGASPSVDHPSRLERYFSWDMINDTTKRKQDDESTLYSDSLSESSAEEDLDPTLLVSSRLEKYFTSGLVDDQHCFYPDDVEFSDDVPVSDFEEDSVHQKISRSALLSSLETSPGVRDSPNTAPSQTPPKKSLQLPSGGGTESQGEDVIPERSSDRETLEEVHGTETKTELETWEKSSTNFDCDPFVSSLPQTDAKLDGGECSQLQSPPSSSETDGSVVMVDDPPVANKPLGANREQPVTDIPSILKKLLSYINETGSESVKANLEKNAWQVLETEIERLLLMEINHSSCNSSCTLDSNNSDYGSDTIESVDCITDDDEHLDAKTRMSAKSHLVDVLNSAVYKNPSSLQSDLNAVRISDETLNIWKRLIQSLQKDNSENKVSEPDAEVSQFVGDQLLTLMHSVDSSQNLEETGSSGSCSLKGDQVDSSELNEAYNVNVGTSSLVASLQEHEIKGASLRIESSSDEGLSPGSVENVGDSSKESQTFIEITKHVLPEKIETREEQSVDDVLLEESSEISPPPELFADPTHSVLPRKPKNRPCLREAPSKENDLKFSVVVDIAFAEDAASETPSTYAVPESMTKPPENLESVPQSNVNDSSQSGSVHVVTSSHESPVSQQPLRPDRSSRDTGYYSFKSSDDSLLNDAPSARSAESLDVPNFKSLKRTVKNFSLGSNTLSKSTNNILQVFSSPDGKFATPHSKSKKLKSSESPSSSPRFSSLFSPSAVLKRFTGSKSSSESPPSSGESSIPPKYLKKYARSVSVDNESLFGAASMPHLNAGPASPRPGDSYSALGLYSENDRDSSLILDDEPDAGRYFSGSQSVLSLGARSVSMTSVCSYGGCVVPVSGDVLFGLNYNQKAQTMEVFVKQCRNLAAVDARNNRSNPYVKVYLLPDKTRSGKRKTKSKKNTLNPIFNELLRFPVLKNELESRTLWMSVWNNDFFGRNDFLGEISLPLGYRLLDSPTLRWYPLQEKVESVSRSPMRYKGELFLALKYVPRDLSMESRFRPAPVIAARGALHVLVKEARNIAAQGGSLDAFCKSYLLPDRSKSGKQKTPVVRRSGHPKWYYTLIYEDLSPEELRERSLEITVWDHRIAGNNERIGAVRLNIGSGLYHGVPVDWMDGKRDESSLWLSMLDSPNMWVDGCLLLRHTL